jgi:hypothetical protein
MAKELVTDEMWEVIEPLLPEEPPKPKGGRPRIDDRSALTDILFVLKSSIPWEMLPQERWAADLWDDLLEAPQGVARGGRVGRTASKAFGPLRRCRPDRLGEGFFRLGECGRPGGSKDR